MSLSIGIIYCGYQCADMLDMSLSPWVEARRARLGGHSYSICAVSVPFEGFPQDEQKDMTHELLTISKMFNEIDHCILGDTPIKETEARGSALKWLVEVAKVDIVIQWDADEEPTEKDILGITSFVEVNPFAQWFRVSYRNLVFTEDQALKEPFTPPRVHRVGAPRGYTASMFYADNNIVYESSDKFTYMSDVAYSSLTIPESVANPLHYTWLNDQRSKRKIEYQTGRGWECSYRWDDTKGLRFNEEYFARRGLPIPEVISLPLTEAT